MDILYYNVLTTCNKQPDDTNTYYAVYNENRSIGLLDNNSYKDYVMSVERIQMCISTIPLFIPSISSVNINTTNYGVQLTCNGNTSSMKYCNYVCKNKYVNNTSDPRYYYIYSIKHIINILNDGLYQCYIELNDITFMQPYFSYDANNIYLNIDDNFVTGVGKISLNPDFYNLIYTFPFIYNINTGLWDMDLNVNYLTYNTINGHNVYTINPDDSPLTNWSPVSNFVVVSNGSNFKEEVQGQVYDVSNTNFSTSYYTPDYQILDICLLGPPTIYNGNILYIPSHERPTVVKNNCKILNFSIQWRNKYNGQLNNIELNNGDFFSMKLKFEKTK